MGWGKGKGKAVERALHHAEREEIWAAERALAHGDVAGAVAHAQKAEVLEHAEHAVHWKGKGKAKGKGYHQAAEVVVVSPAPVVAAVPTEVVIVSPEVVSPAPVLGKGMGKAVEHALHREEVHEKKSALAALAHGDVVGATIHAERARELHRVEKEVHHEVLHAKAREAHRAERREEHLAARDLAHGDILGAISHEVKAVEAHRRGHRIEAELHHDHWAHPHKGWGKGKGKGKGW